MSDTRVGRQTPTLAVVLPYEESHGGETVALYDQSKRSIMWDNSTLTVYVSISFPVY